MIHSRARKGDQLGCSYNHHIISSGIISVFVFVVSKCHIYYALVIIGCLYMFGPKSIYIYIFT